jgi:hypothetical protein
VATADELAAEQWQRNHAAAIAKRESDLAALHGSDTLRHQLDVDWDPLVQWLRERGTSIPVDEDPL